MSPRELDGILQQVSERERRMFVPAALICATVCNVHRDASKHPEPYTVADFLPGEQEGELTDEEFAEMVMNGETFEVSPEAAANFRRQMEAAFRNIQSGVTNVGPRGKETVQRS